MNKKMDSADGLTIRQDLWDESPCSHCSDVHCCKNLPLAPLRLTSQSDFINLILTSSYNGIFPVYKKTGEWTFYLKRDCSYLGKPNGQCTIHKESHQSLICKSYDAHTCWYVEAFSTERYTTMIPFNTDMIIWFEKRYKLIDEGFDAEIDWDELCDAAYNYRWNTIPINTAAFEPWSSFTLSFKRSRSDQFLFLPPYNRPETRNHFELLSFRLSFPGIYLAISDTCWAFMVKTDLNKQSLNLIRREYYPVIGHNNGTFSFDSIKNEFRPFSGTGEQWVILQRSDLETLKNVTIFDETGNVRHIPTSSEILHALKTENPNRVA